MRSEGRVSTVTTLDRNTLEPTRVLDPLIQIDRHFLALMKWILLFTHSSPTTTIDCHGSINRPVVSRTGLDGNG